MWVLESDGDIFGHKKLWLRPGRSFLFGRTSNHGGSPLDRGFAISHKGVSRKHLVISVGPVEPRQGSRVDQKSKLTISDESKFGTVLDGEKFIKDIRTLSRDEHAIKLGSWDQVLKIKWRPVVLTTASTKRTAVNDPLQKLEAFDVKVISEFLFDKTTHVVSSKRNLPKVLQALVGAKYVVKDTFVDAIVQAASSPGTEEDGETPLQSLLEQDFDRNWPDAMRHVPPPSGEPVPRSDPSFLTPDESRTSIFEGFTFVFCASEQQASLEPALSLGGAKCPLFQVEVGKTEPQELVNFVRSLPGVSKDLGSKGPAIVRVQTKQTDLLQWTASFTQEVDRELDQRSIVQNEFLDVVLTRDTSSLRKSLEYEDEEPPSMRDAAPMGSNVQASQRASRTATRSGDANQDPQEQSQAKAPSQDPAQSSNAPSQPSEVPVSRFRSRRAVTRSRFKGFDDFDDDEFQVLPSEPSAQEPSQAVESMEVDPTPPSNQQQGQRHMDPDEEDASQGLFVGESQRPKRASTKRRMLADTDQPLMDQDAMMEEMLPGARAAKKRRLERGESATPAAPAVAEAPSKSPSPDNGKAKGKGKAKSGKEQKADFRSRAKEHANMIDKVKQEEQPNDYNEDRAERLRDLAIVEEMDVPRLQERRSNRSGRQEQDRDDERWDPAWAGRKNFKKFRRKGAAGDEPQGQYNRGTRVIVSLEPVKEKDYGIGDHYWTSFPSSHNSKKKKGKGTQSQSQSQPARDAAGIDEVVERDSDVEADEAERARLEEVLPDELVGPQRQTWVKDAVKKTKKSSQNVDTQVSGRGKRPAASSIDESPSKRRKQTPAGSARARGRINLQPIDEDDDESDEDEFKFKLRK